MTVAAMRLSATGERRVPRATARCHANIWRELWPDRHWEAVPIGHVTNGVHLATWMATPIMALLDEHLGPNWGERLEEPGFWDQVLTLDHARALGGAPQAEARSREFVREDARRRFAGQLKEAAQVVGAGTLLDPMAFTIGFAPPLRDVQAGQPDLSEHRAASTAAGRSVAAGADHLRRQGAPGRQSR